jgi:hypothetical protein
MASEYVWSQDSIQAIYRLYQKRVKASSALEDHFDELKARYKSRVKNLISLLIATGFFAILYAQADMDAMYSAYFLAAIFAFPLVVFLFHLLNYLRRLLQYRSSVAKQIHAWREEVGEDVWMVAVLGGPFDNRLSLRANTGYLGHALSDAAYYVGGDPASLAVAAGVLVFKLGSYLVDSAYDAATKKSREQALVVRTRQACIAASVALEKYAQVLEDNKSRGHRYQLKVSLTEFAMNEVSFTASLIPVE